VETSEKIRENRLRHMADRYGLRLVKSRRRDPRSPDYGLYALIMVENGGAVNPSIAGHFTCSWDLDEVEHYLTAPDHVIEAEERAAIRNSVTWKESQSRRSK